MKFWSSDPLAKPREMHGYRLVGQKLWWGGRSRRAGWIGEHQFPIIILLNPTDYVNGICVGGWYYTAQPVDFLNWYRDV